MLVLLIVFLITTQVIKQAVPVKLPDVRYEPTMTKPENVSLTVRNGPGGTCEVYWGVQKVTQQQLLDKAVKKLKKLIKSVGGVQNINEENMPEAHIRGDVNTPVQVHRRSGHHDAGGRVPACRLHFRAAAAAPAIGPNRSSSPCQCRPPATILMANR